MTGLSFTSCKKTETRSTPTSAVETRAVPQSKIDMIRNWTDHVLDSARKNGYKFGTRSYKRIALSLSNRIQVAGHSLSIEPVGDSLNSIEFNPYIKNAYALYSYWNGTHHMLWLDGNTENRGNYVKQTFLGTAYSSAGPDGRSPIPLYRFFNGITGCHLFTSDANEAYAISQHPRMEYYGWNPEGVVCYVDFSEATISNTTIHRFHKVQNGPEDYYYTSAESVSAAGYQKEVPNFSLYYYLY